MVQHDEPDFLDWDQVHTDLEAVRRYGEGHPDALVDVRVSTEPRGRVVVLLSPGDFDNHADALRRLVHLPEKLDVERSAWSASHLAGIAAEVDRMAHSAEPGAFKRWGPGWGNITVGLRADQEALATILHERYGDAISLTVGQFPYPSGRPSTLSEQIRATVPSAAGHPTPVAPEAVLIPGLETRLELTPSHVQAGHDGRGRVFLRNVGATRLDIATGQPLTGAVIDPATGETVSGGSMAIAGTGLAVSLKPGEEASIQLLFLTASGHPELGYALPPGRYLVRTAIPIHTTETGPGRPRRVLPVPAAELIIVDRQPNSPGLPAP